MSGRVRRIGVVLRGVGWADYYSVGGKECIAANLEILAEVEHNRWNMEKLLMGFRPTSDEEHELIKADAEKKKGYKDRFIHDDIRPFSELDDAAKDIDWKLVNRTYT